MKIIRFHRTTVVILAGVVLLGTGVATAQASKPALNHKVTLCHRTGSAEGGNTHDGYSIITVDIASVANTKDVRGHDSHGQIGNGPGGDIIPSFTYPSFTYPGKNLGSGGAAFLENRCRETDAPPTTVLPTTVLPTTDTTTTTTTVEGVEGVGGVGGVGAAVALAGGEANPLPAAASAGQVDTRGQLVAGGFAVFAGFLMLVAGFVLRRRHGEA